MSTTVDQARRDLLAKLDEGVVCPCCGQLARRYRRALDGMMAEGLVRLVIKFLQTKDWVHVHDIPLGDRDVRAMGGHFALLRHWGLTIAKERDESTRGRTSGYWKPTAHGIDFALSRRAEPAAVFIYNNTVYGKDSRKILIRDSLDEKFDYLSMVSPYLTTEPQAELPF